MHPSEGPHLSLVPGVSLKPPLEPRGCTPGLLRGHLSQWGTRSILSGPPIPGVCMPRATQGLSCTRTAHILAGRAVVGLVAGGIRYLGTGSLTNAAVRSS